MKEYINRIISFLIAFLLFSLNIFNTVSIFALDTFDDSDIVVINTIIDNKESLTELKKMGLHNPLIELEDEETLENNYSDNSESDGEVTILNINEDDSEPVTSESGEVEENSEIEDIINIEDSIEEKGSNARVHTGLIAQDLRNTLDDFEIDASKYGFFCYDKWDDQYDVQHITVTDTDESGNETVSQKEVKTLKKPAGEQYSLRYQEIQAIENAYLRNEIKKLNEKIEELSRLINS